MIRGILAWSLIIILLLVYIFYNCVLSKILLENGLVNKGFSLDLLIYIASIILFVLIITWALRNKIWLGLNYAFKHYFLVKSLRKQLKEARVSQEQELEYSIVEIPKIKIDFDDNKKRGQGKIYIENSIRFDIKLEDIRIDASLKGYVVESQYLSLDRKWYVFEIFSVQDLKQIAFNTQEEYLRWAKKDCSDYQLRLDDRTWIPLHHMGISGQTGSGKTFFLQALLDQLTNKNVEHNIYIIDPKCADLFNIGKTILPEGQVANAEAGVELIKKFDSIIRERQATIEHFLKANKNSTYEEAKLPSIILIIDEFGAWRADIQRLAKSERDEIDGILSKIAFMGRQLGIFLWVCTQQMNSQTIATSVREQLVVKIVLGMSDEQTYRTLFAQSVDIPSMKFHAGEGLISAPAIASVEHPRLLFVPNLVYLKTII